MEIVWLGHSSVRLRSGNSTLITDPFEDSVGFAMGDQSAEIVTCSNDHPHHSNVDAVAGNPQVLNGPGEYEIANFYLTGMGTRLCAAEGERKLNTVFTFLVEGLRLCHLGDLNQMLSPRQVEELNQTDVLFVPAGGVCTIDTAKVVELISLIGPRVVVPIHYWVGGVTVELEPLDAFLTQMGVAEASPVARLNLTPTNLPRDREVVVLQRAVG